MFQTKWNIQTELTIGVIVALALLTTITITTMTNFETSALPISITNSESVNTFNAVLPDRSLVFQRVTGPGGVASGTSRGSSAGGPGIVDGRLFAGAPGIAGALAAIYPSTAGFDVYSIDPTTGDGTFAFRIIRAQVYAAQLDAMDSGEAAVIGEGLGIIVYALPTGECNLHTSFPDGKPFDLVFAC